MPSLIVAVDSEFQPITNNKTRPISVQIQATGMKEKFFIHPRSSDKVQAKAREVRHTIFESPFVIIDYLGCEWKPLEGNPKNYERCDIHIFYSFKDIEFTFRDEETYSKFVLPQLSRTRRISSKTQVSTDVGYFSVDSIGLPYMIRLPDENNGGKMRWYKLSISITDICAMQGAESLHTYAKNVGIEMLTKSHYNAIQKANMEQNYIDDALYFEDYAMGDTPLVEIKKETVKFYNHIGEIIGITPKNVDEFWGLSTGKIVASMLNDWICVQLKTSSEELYQANKIAGSEGITGLSKTIKSPSLVYCAMVDGGRAVKERALTILLGYLIDIDIDGCYGNGLKNQFYAVGTPTITDKKMTLKDWLKKYKKQLIPGLWYARISWDNAPFRQDLLISKTDEAFTSWYWVVNGRDNEGFNILDDGNKVYDASMALTTNSLHQASLNHDLLQALEFVSSNQEWGWLLNNAYIESSLIYERKNEVKEVTSCMKKGAELSNDANVIVKGSKKWVRVELANLATLLLTERKKHPKKTPLNTFLKLIINTIYGCIASEFFSVKNSCVSNVIVGNNITARARCLGWVMAKGLHSVMTITDGGVFDINNVLEFKRMSLNLLEQLHRDNFNVPSDRQFFARQKPLLDNVISIDTSIDLKEVDRLAWEHLKNIFTDLDIFKFNQFSFESKFAYHKLILHSKVDYLLETATGEKTVAFRGMPKIWSEEKQKKIVNPVVYKLFDAIEKDEPIKVELETTELLSLADWKANTSRDNNYELLPHDQISKTKVFYSHTPKGYRCKDLSEYKKLERDYQYAKNLESADEVAKVKPDE